MENTKLDITALFNIGYGLYVITSHDGTKDNGCIVNSVMQVTNTPNRVAVVIDKKNYSHEIIRRTTKMNVNVLSVNAPFSVFENFGFRSGRDCDKFENQSFFRSENGLAVLSEYINSFISLQVEEYVDMDSHGMFVCTLTEAQNISKDESMTYAYYHKNVKPRPNAAKKKGYVCKICGYVYEGEELPEDFICPWCKHPASDFEELK